MAIDQSGSRLRGSDGPSEMLECPACYGKANALDAYEHSGCGSIGFYGQFYHKTGLSCPKCLDKLDLEADLVALGPTMVCGDCMYRFEVPNAIPIGPVVRRAEAR